MSGALDLRDLRRANVERQAEWCPDQKPDLAYRGNELAGETGEACNIIKKLERERHGWRGSRSTIEALASELADVVICADLAAHAAGVDLAEAVRQAFNATSEKNGLATLLPQQASALAVTRAESIMRGRLLSRTRDTLINVRDGVEDEGDRTYFGSTNDADTFKDAVERLDAFTWDLIMAEKGEPDVFEVSQKAHRRIAELEAEILALQAARGELVRHVKRGTEYEVIGEAEVQISTHCTCPDGKGNGVLPGSTIIKEGRAGDQGDRLTVYRCLSTGKLWCRLPEEFRDGRFVTVAPAPSFAKGSGEKE